MRRGHKHCVGAIACDEIESPHRPRRSVHACHQWHVSESPRLASLPQTEDYHRPMPDNSVILKPGDELRVDRGLYHHHGFYVGNGAVVQFGGRIKDKPRASIHHVALPDFAKDGRVKVVEHKQLDRDAAVRRALWLLDNPPPTTYHLFGYNCEHVARWCATGKIESSQAKSAFAANSFMGGGLFVFAGHPHGWLFGLLQLIFGLFLMWLSRGATRKFEEHIRNNCPE